MSKNYFFIMQKKNRAYTELLARARKCPNYGNLLCELCQASSLCLQKQTGVEKEPVLNLASSLDEKEPSGLRTHDYLSVAMVRDAEQTIV